MQPSAHTSARKKAAPRSMQKRFVVPTPETSMHMPAVPVNEEWPRHSRWSNLSKTRGLSVDNCREVLAARARPTVRERERERERERARERECVCVCVRACV